MGAAVCKSEGVSRGRAFQLVGRQAFGEASKRRNVFVFRNHMVVCFRITGLTAGKSKRKTGSISDPVFLSLA